MATKIFSHKKNKWQTFQKFFSTKGPVVQSIVSRTNLLVSHSLSYLARILNMVLIFFAYFFRQKKMPSLCAKFNVSLTSVIISFKQMGPGPEVIKLFHAQLI